MWGKFQVKGAAKETKGNLRLFPLPHSLPRALAVLGWGPKLTQTRLGHHAPLSLLQLSHLLHPPHPFQVSVLGIPLCPGFTL